MVDPVVLWSVKDMLQWSYGVDAFSVDPKLEEGVELNVDQGYGRGNSNSHWQIEWL